MRRLFLLLLACAPPCSAQMTNFTAPDCGFDFRFTVTANVITSTSGLSAQRLPISPPGVNNGSPQIGFDNRGLACTTWQITGQSQGVSAISIELDQAPIPAGDVGPGTWTLWANPAPGTVFPVTATGTFQGSVFSYQPWVSVNLNSATGTGTVYGRVYGWRPQAGQDVTAAGNSVIIAGFTYKQITTATNTQLKATPGVLHTITITQPGATSNSITIVDTSVAACTGGTTIATIPSAQLVSALAPVTLTFDIATVNGLCITTAGTTSPQLVASYR